MTTRKVVLMDQDGPLAGFDESFFKACADRGWDLHSTVDTQCHRFATDCLLDQSHTPLARELINSQGWFYDLEPTPGAIEGINELQEHADVWICTKPLETNPWCRDEKAAWVRKYLGDEWETRLIIAPDKSLVRGDYLVDDAIKPEWFQRAEWEPVVFPMPWNGEGSDWEGLRTWKWGDPVEVLLEG